MSNGRLETEDSASGQTSKTKENVCILLVVYMFTYLLTYLLIYLSVMLQQVLCLYCMYKRTNIKSLVRL